MPVEDLSEFYPDEYPDEIDYYDMDRSVLPKYYSRVPTSTTGSTISEDCASNTTLLTNTSPFNSQQALISNKKKENIVKNNNNNYIQTHYYAENIKHENDLRNTKNYNPLTKEVDLSDYKQLEPLINKDSVLIETSEMDIEEVKNKENDRRPIGWQIPDSPDIPKVIITPKIRRRPIFHHYLRYVSQVVAALSVSLGSMVVGFSCAYTSPALVSMKNRNITSFEVDLQTESWIGSLMPLSALFGGIAGGPAIEYLGRRNTILATAFPFIAAWMCIAMASNVWLVFVGRALTGFCVGIASLSLPVYLGETIQAEVRGTLGLLPTAFGNIGILIAFIGGMYLNWSQLAFFGTMMPIPFLILMFLIPETPRWYISKGNTKKARKALEWLRGKNTDVSDELASVEKIHVESEKNATQNTLGELFKSNNIKPLLISLGLMFFQQMSGINAVIFYTENIFQDAGSTIDSSLCTIIVGIVNFVSTFIATALIDRLGRKILLYISSISMTVTLVSLSAFFYFKDHEYDVQQYGWIPLVSFVIYVVGFSLGFGPIPWLMMGEILPAKIRGPAASIATSFNWACTFIVTKTFNDIIAGIGTSGTFLMFAIVVAIGFIFIIFFVPETRGKSLEEIENRLTGPVRRMSAVANMKPMPTAC